MRTCNILGINVAVTNMNETVTYIEDNIEKLKGKYVCVSNVHTAVMSYEDEEYRNIQNGACLILPDGNPLSSVSRKRGFKEAKRVTGPDLMGRIFEDSMTKGYKHYFYGSTKETLKLLNEKLLNKYPNINIVGMYSPPFRKEVTLETEQKIKEINDLKPDFIWVGLGAPKQERWMARHNEKLNGLMIGVGAGFDYYAGKIKRAPRFMQNNSLEWLYRLFQDPKRLCKRYLKTNFKFIYLTKIKKERY